MTVLLPLSLTEAGAAALINLWLAIRVGQVRTAHKIMVGDGGHTGLTAAMRAHANFIEYTPFVLILVVLLELAYGPAVWLWLVTAAYLLGRLAHALGMVEPAPPLKLRMIGTIVTFLTLLGLGGAALYTTYGEMQRPRAAPVIEG